MTVEINKAEPDVSLLALETTLTAIKGVGWSTETLVAIMAAIVALPPGSTAAQVWAYATRELTNPGVASNLGNMQVDGLTQAPAGQKTWLLAAAYMAERGTDLALLAASFPDSASYTAAKAAFLDAAISTRAIPGDAMALTAAERLIVQALIISDLTPFAGADIAAILADTATIDWTDVLAIPLTPELEANALARYNTLVGYVDDLETRLTAARAGYLDNINNAQLLNISAAILARIDVAISSRLATASYTAERGTDNAMLAASYVTERGTDGAALAASWTAALATVLGNYTAARAGYLDNINNAQLLNISATILGRIDAAISSRSTLAFTSYMYSASLAAGATYTPPAKTLSTLFCAGGALASTYIHVEFYSGAVWYDAFTGTSKQDNCNIFTDTAQSLRVHNGSASAVRFILTGVTWA